MGDPDRLARAQALAAMYKDHRNGAGGSHGSHHPAERNGSSKSASSAPHRPPRAELPLPENPAALVDRAVWGKTRLVDHLPSWVRAHQREVAHLKAWADALVDRALCVACGCSC